MKFRVFLIKKALPGWMAVCLEVTMVLRSILKNHVRTFYTSLQKSANILLLPFDTKIQQVQTIWWVIIESITYFEKQFSKIIYFWWGPEGIWIFIFETDKSSFHLLAQPWSCCTKSVSTLGVSSGRISTIFSHKGDPAQWGLRKNLMKSRSVATL